MDCHKKLYTHIVSILYLKIRTCQNNITINTKNYVEIVLTTSYAFFPGKSTKAISIWAIIELRDQMLMASVNGGPKKDFRRPECARTVIHVKQGIPKELGCWVKYK